MEIHGLRIRVLQSAQMKMILFTITWMMLTGFWQPLQYREHSRCKDTMKFQCQVGDECFKR